MCTFFKGLSSLKMLVLLTSVIALTLVSCTGENTGVLTPSSKTEVTNQKQVSSLQNQEESVSRQMYTYTLNWLNGLQRESSTSAGNWVITITNTSNRTQTVKFCMNNPGNYEERTLAPGAYWTKSGNGWVYVSASATAFVASTIPLY